MIVYTTFTAVKIREACFCHRINNNLISTCLLHAYKFEFIFHNSQFVSCENHSGLQFTFLKNKYIIEFELN